MSTVAAPKHRAYLSSLLTEVKRVRRYDIGFPGATDLLFPELAEWLTAQLLNNIGDPWDSGHGRNHSKDLEREVISTVARMLRAPQTFWGYVTGGASEGTLHALDEAWQAFPDVVIYTSGAAHYSVSKAARLLKLPLVLLQTHADGRMDVNDLAREVGRRRDRAAMVVATAGTTMTEAVDDVSDITQVLDSLHIRRRRLHVDAALSGLPLSLLEEYDRPAFDFTAGTVSSMVISGHKFLSSLMPCGVLVYAESPYATAGGRVTYTGSMDTTIAGSRSGHTPLILWTVLHRISTDGHRSRAEKARQLAEYTCGKLNAIGITATRNPHAFTVVLPTPPPSVLEKWVLAVDGQQSHVITMPGIEQDQLDEFLTDMAAALPATAQDAGRERVRGLLAVNTAGT